MKVQRLPIAGLACPYGVANSYGETIERGAFSPAYLARLNRTGLPVWVSHEPPSIGRWTEFDDRPDGLYVKGYINSPHFIEVARSCPEEQRKLSISYTCVHDPHPRIDRLNILKSLRAGREVFDPVLVKAALLDEISCVDKGAFKEAYFQIIGDVQKT